MADSMPNEEIDDDFYRWFVGGEPPESDRWPRHAFENAWCHNSIQPQGDEDVWPR